MDYLRSSRFSARCALWVEHYESSRYGALKASATKRNLPPAIKLLDQTLAEEKNTDDTLSKIAETAVNY